VCLTRLARVAVAQGRFSTAQRLVQEAMEIADATEHPLTRADACCQLGVIAAVQGDAARAVPLLERALHVADEHHIRVLHPLLPAYLGYALALVGRREAAMGALARVLEDGPSGLRNVAMGHAWAVAAAGLREAGNLAASRSAAERGLELVKRRGERVYEPETLLQLAIADASDAPPRWPDAESRYEETLAKATSMGLRPIVAHCHLGLGRLHGARGNASTAREHLDRAAVMFREMDMTSWVAQAEAARSGS
jgi:tetratricopeptide (TPR) repeat protein